MPLLRKPFFWPFSANILLFLCLILCLQPVLYGPGASPSDGAEAVHSAVPAIFAHFMVLMAST